MNWVTPFVQKTGCKVHVRTVRSSTELLDAVSSGRYDGVAAFGDVTQVLTGGHEVEPLDLSRIPHYRDVFPALKRLPQNLDGGNRRGPARPRAEPAALADRSRPPGPGSWDVLYDHRYAGRIGLYDAAVSLAQTAIHLGLGSPYELDHAQFRRVVRAAADQSADAGFYWQDLTNALADYTGGNAIVGEASPRLAALLKADQVPVATTLPPDRPRSRPPGCCSPAPGTRLHVPLARLHRHGEAQRHLGPLPRTRRPRPRRRART